MKPFQPRCPSAQIERKWPATKDYFSFGEEAIAFLTGSRARGAWCQVACRGEGRPRFANFPVIPAPGVGQFDRRSDGLNLCSIFGADALNTQDVDPLHARLPRLCDSIALRPIRTFDPEPICIVPMLRPVFKRAKNLVV